MTIQTTTPTKPAIDSLEEVLFSQIPLTRAMDLKVMEYTAAGLLLNAPLEPNINHQQTAFGGSLASLTTLACWGLLWLKLRDAQIPADIVIQESNTRFIRPVTGEIYVRAEHPPADSWLRFVQTLRSHGKARIELESSVQETGQPATCFRGKFVAKRS